MTSLKTFNVISLFSGAGGLDIGFESTGHFSTVLAIDWSDYCIATLEKNKQLHHVISNLPIKPWESDLTTEGRSIVLLENTIIKKMDLSVVSKTDIQDQFPGYPPGDPPVPGRHFQTGATLGMEYPSGPIPGSPTATETRWWASP